MIEPPAHLIHREGISPLAAANDPESFGNMSPNLGICMKTNVGHATNLIMVSGPVVQPRNFGAGFHSRSARKRHWTIDTRTALCRPRFSFKRRPTQLPNNKDCAIQQGCPILILILIFSWATSLKSTWMLYPLGKLADDNHILPLLPEAVGRFRAPVGDCSKATDRHHPLVRRPPCQR